MGKVKTRMAGFSLRLFPISPQFNPWKLLAGIGLTGMKGHSRVNVSKLI
jgi:hypothetical protein